MRPNIMIARSAIAGLCVLAQLCLAGEDEDLLATYGDRDTVSIATGTRQSLVRAPSVASVITAEDIRATGATDIDEVLRSVPGLHVSVSPGGYNPIYVMRGIYSQYNPQVLVLLNGIPLTNVFIGDRGQAWGGMPVNNIKRIEVIRGPGSALYGADAFAGVINIVTKTAPDIAGTEAGFGAGSFDSGAGWLLHGGKWGSLDTAVALEIGKTGGFRNTVNADAQSALDGLFGTSASHAPGPVETGREQMDLRLDFGVAKWRLRTGYQGRRKVGTGVGAAQALDPQGKSESDRFSADLTYITQDLAKGWEVQAQASFLDTATRSDLFLFPKNALGGAFPDGVIGNPDVYERHTRLGVVAQYDGLPGHKLRMGTGLNIDDLYKVRETKNFTQNAAGIPLPLGSVVDVTKTAPFVRTEDRSIVYAFVQDEWAIRPDWTLTAGVRADDYSDVGSTVNPRLALVWDTRYNLTSKLLLGRAFRAPSFQELYNINNPVALGNPSLRPETIESVELAFVYRPAQRLSVNLNLFHYEIDRFLRFVRDPFPATSLTAQNAAKLRANGLEVETSWELTDALRLSGHVAVQRSKDVDTDADPGNAPRKQAYLRLDWRFAPLWAFDSQVKWVSKRERAPGDARPALDGYTLTDLTLVRRPARDRGWEFALSLRNALDADAAEPSPDGLVPGDLPLAGRALRLDVRRRF